MAFERDRSEVPDVERGDGRRAQSLGSRHHHGVDKAQSERLVAPIQVLGTPKVARLGPFDPIRAGREIRDE
jgi:hypothetical protein